MKKFLTFILPLLALWGCSQQDFAGAAGEGEAVLTLTADLPADLSQVRAPITGGSDKGGFDNVDWNTFRLRYILEVYDADSRLVVRQQKYKDSNEAGAAKSESFSVRLIPGKSYNVVLWSDFIRQGSEEDLYYLTSSQQGLRAVTLRTEGGYVGNDDSRDAFFANERVTIACNEMRTIVLRRPFGKVRVITTDATEPALTGADGVRVSYATPLAGGIDVSTGELLANESLADVVYTSEISAAGNEGTSAGYMTVSFDYILAPPTTEAAPVQVPHNFTVALLAGGNELAAYDFSTGIPIERNHLTTVLGNLFTNRLDINISVDDDFDGEINWDGVNPDTPPLFVVNDEQVEPDLPVERTFQIAADQTEFAFTVKTNQGLLAGLDGLGEITPDPTCGPSVCGVPVTKAFSLQMQPNSTREEVRHFVILSSNEGEPNRYSYRAVIVQAAAPAEEVFEVTVTNAEAVPATSTSAATAENESKPFTVTIPGDQTTVAYSVRTNMGLLVSASGVGTIEPDPSFEDTGDEIKVVTFTLQLGTNSSSSAPRTATVSVTPNPAGSYTAYQYEITQQPYQRPHIEFEDHTSASELEKWASNDLQQGEGYLFQWGQQTGYRSSAYSTPPASWVTHPNRGWQNPQGPCPTGYHIADEADFKSIFKTSGAYRQIGSRKYYVSTTNGTRGPHEVTYYEVDDFGDRIEGGKSGTITLRGNGTLVPNNFYTDKAPTTLAYSSYPYYWVYYYGSCKRTDCSYGITTITTQAVAGYAVSNTQYHAANSIRCVAD